jgi:hypothetical protein
LIKSFACLMWWRNSSIKMRLRKKGMRVQA